MLKEQDYLCAYCQRKISAKTSTIEHYCEQNICNGKIKFVDRRLDYTNLFAVCSGKLGFGNLCCDQKKATFTIPILPIEVNPTVQQHIDAIYYTSAGIIKSHNCKHKKELNEVLNLNSKLFKASRKTAWIELFRLSKRTNKPSKQKLKMKRLLESEIAKKGSYVGMYEYMLKKYFA